MLDLINRIKIVYQYEGITGLRERITNRLVRKEPDVFTELNILSRIDKNYCEKQVLPDKKQHDIAFIIGGLLRSSGGHSDILRLGTYLSKLGHNVFYITYDDSKVYEMEQNACANLPDYKGTFLPKYYLEKGRFDIGIATFWKSCYYLLAYQYNFAYKAYLIQDFEPLYYPMGDVSYLALNTYKLGFHMISLVEWSSHQIENATDIKPDHIDYPLNTDQYSVLDRRLEIKDNLNIAVNIRMDPKRGPHLLIEQLKYLMNNINDELNINIKIFGLNKDIKIPIAAENIGNKLSHEELRELYINSHFGVVVSWTDFSLVNYEMAASGIPVIGIKEGSAPFYFKKDEMIFIGTEAKSLLEKVEYYINNQDELNLIVSNARKKLIKRPSSWNTVGKQFAELLGVYKV